MTWNEYLEIQQEALERQKRAIQAELEPLPRDMSPFAAFVPAATDALRAYLQQAARLASRRTLRHFPDGPLRSFFVARRMRRFLRDHCQVRMQVHIGPSGDPTYPELVYTMPPISPGEHRTRVRSIDTTRARDHRPFLAFDQQSSYGSMFIYPAQGGLPAYTQVLVPLPSQRKDRRPDRSTPLYENALEELACILQPTLDAFRSLVLAEERRQFLYARLREIANRQQQYSRAETVWQKVVLPEKQKLQLQQQVDLLLDGRTICPQAVLLQGVPGTGKTLLARTLAELLGQGDFHLATVATLKAPNLGQSAQRVADLWARACAQRPSVLFLDECEGLLGKRGAAETDSASTEIVQTFLSLWDGKQTGPWVIGATNRPDLLDDAILSRFGCRMELPLPNTQARLDILRQELAALGRHGEVPAGAANATAGFSGRDLAMLAGKVRTLAYPGEFTAQHFHAAIASMRRASSTPVDENATWETLVLDKATKEKLQVLCALLGNTEAWKARGVSIPRGLLLCGPPGTGKTQIARTLANESGLSFLSATTADLKANFLGQSANRVQQLFARARASAPTILFLDELDILTRDRTVSGNDSLVQEIIGQLLQEIDGVRRSEAHIFLLAATNHVDHVDASIRDRLQEVIPVPLPGLEARARLLEIFLAGRPLDFPLADVLHPLAERYDGCSGREIKNRVARAEQRAVLRAIQRGGPEHCTLTLEDFGLDNTEAASAV